MLVNQHFKKSFCKYGEDDCKQLDGCLYNSSLVMYKNQLILQKLSVLWKPIPIQCRSHIRLTQIKVQSGSEHCRTWNNSPGEKICAWLSLRRDGGTLSDYLRTLRPSVRACRRRRCWTSTETSSAEEARPTRARASGGGESRALGGGEILSRGT